MLEGLRYEKKEREIVAEGQKKIEDALKNKLMLFMQKKDEIVVEEYTRLHEEDIKRQKVHLENFPIDGEET